MVRISRLYLLVLVATAFLRSSGFIMTRIQSFIRRVKTSVKETNWMDALLKVDKVASKFNGYRKTIKFDISAGYGAISSPERDLTEFDEIIDELNDPRKSPVLWVHKAGRNAVRKAPDKALLGGFVLIASELLRRCVNNEKYPLPPSIREFANTTSTELDSKLEQLSSLNWKVDPFLKGEYENLQSQPLVVIDKFLANTVLPSVDTELAPFLLKSMVDTSQVKMITQNVKDLVKLSMNLLESTATENIPTQLNSSILDEATSSLNRTTTTIIEQVDVVGQGIEEVVNDWNRNVVQFTGSIAQYLNTDSILNVLSGQYPLKVENHSEKTYNASNESPVIQKVKTKEKTEESEVNTGRTGQFYSDI